MANKFFFMSPIGGLQPNPAVFPGTQASTHLFSFPIDPQFVKDEFTLTGRYTEEFGALVDPFIEVRYSTTSSTIPGQLVGKYDLEAFGPFIFTGVFIPPGPGWYQVFGGNTVNGNGGQGRAWSLIFLFG